MQPSAIPRPAYDEPATAEEAVMVTLALLGRRMRARLPGEELDFAAILLLKALMHGGPMRLSALAASLDLDASTVSRQVRHLEDRGLLERTSDPDDGRASRITLSEQGRVRLEAGARRRRAMVAQLLEHWPDRDREQLRVLLNRLLDDLAQDQETP
ncbi:MAG TPA: MarR family transcriptional regulator [Nocardioidaceae bacterium]|nr:MarR family transcriptional regulator [Nocardioidaceae bacterium]